jgi:hypothetical protein
VIGVNEDGAGVVAGDEEGDPIHPAAKITRINPIVRIQVLRMIIP